MSAGNHNQTLPFLDSEFRYIVFPPFYSLVFILGLIANCYALYILVNIRDVKAVNEVRIYMTNLTVVDLLYVVALPFWIDYYLQKGNWRFPEFVCRVAGSMFFINTYCSILFLAVISFNRYWVVTQPLNAATSDHWRRGVVVSAVIWVFSLSTSAVNLGLNSINKDNETLRCFEGYHYTDDSMRKRVAITHFLIIAFFFLVFLLVVVCNVLIARVLLTRPASPHGTHASVRSLGLKHRALAMVMVVLLVFVVCFVPHHLVQGPWTLAVLSLAMQDDEASRQSLNDAHQITLMLMGLNCLMDPVVYCLATKMFRSFIAVHFKKVMRGRNCPRSTTQSMMTMESQPTLGFMGPKAPRVNNMPGRSQI